MNLLEFYNFYSNTLEDRSYGASLFAFYEEVISKRINLSKKTNVLDLGCGLKSLFEDVENAENLNVLAIDNVSIAIQKAKQSNTIENVKYELVDITKEIDSLGKFDLILDSHLMHCVTKSEDRKKAFENIFSLLSDDGLFCAEMMVSSSRKEELQNKYVPRSIELENELIGHGFKIKYFMIEPGLMFVDSNSSCDLCRIVCTK